jgi:hypothetical protein
VAQESPDGILDVPARFRFRVSAGGNVKFRYVCDVRIAFPEKPHSETDFFPVHPVPPGLILPV